jgi:hypothetical protein
MENVIVEEIQQIQLKINIIPNDIQQEAWRKKKYFINVKVCKE